MKVLLTKYTWVHYVIYTFISLSLFFGVYEIIKAEEAGNNPRFVLIRLEDIGPGGYYGSLEGLGKLRTVLEFLHKQHVPYSMTVIPRWINILPDGTRYDRSLDQIDPSYILPFTNLLHQAIQDGASLGMHGYTHQVGSVPRADGQHTSGTGNEFNVPGLPETTTALYAEGRVNQGLRVFSGAGFVPRFWEAPHYDTTPEQNQVFRSYFGLLYQPNTAIDPNPPAAQYSVGLNSGYGASSIGSVNVPTPFSYIPYNKDETRILNQIDKSKGITSFFFHPFLEFQHLIPVVDKEGHAVLRDGLPDYKYPEENKSILQKLVANFKLRGYSFYSIHDYVPFTPAHRVDIGSDKGTNIQVGDVAGRGQADIIAWDKKTDNITVIEGHFKGMRNESQPAPEIWASLPYTDGAAFTLNRTQGDIKKGMWVVHPKGKLESYSSNGSNFILNHTWDIPSNRWLDLHELRQPNGDCVLAGLSWDQRKLLGVYLHNGVAKPIEPYIFKSNSAKQLQVRFFEKQGEQGFLISQKNTSNGVQLDFDSATMKWKVKKVQWNIPAKPGELRFGDFNGDGKEDILRWDDDLLQYTVYRQTEDNKFKLLSVFGPWGRSNGRLMIADFDQNGKQDLAMISNETTYMDLALSYQSANQ